MRRERVTVPNRLAVMILVWKYKVYLVTFVINVFVRFVHVWWQCSKIAFVVGVKITVWLI